MRRAEWIAGHRLIVAVATLIAIGYLIASLARGPNRRLVAVPTGALAADSITGLGATTLSGERRTLHPAANRD